MTTDAKHVENLAGLSEVKSSTPKLSTAAEAAMSRRGKGVVSCLGSSDPANRQDYEAKKYTDSASARETHAGGELVQCPGGDLHGPRSSPSCNGRVWSAD